MISVAWIKEKIEFSENMIELYKKEGENTKSEFLRGWYLEKIAEYKADIEVFTELLTFTRLLNNFNKEV